MVFGLEPTKTSKHMRNVTGKSRLAVERQLRPQVKKGIFGYVQQHYPRCLVYKHERNSELMELKHKLEQAFRPYAPVSYFSFMPYKRVLKYKDALVYGLLIGFHVWERPFSSAPSLLIAWETAERGQFDTLLDAMIKRLDEFSPQEFIRELGLNDNDKATLVFELLKEVIYLVRYPSAEETPDAEETKGTKETNQNQ